MQSTNHGDSSIPPNTVSVDGKNLPPPGLSRESVDRLLRSLITDSGASSSSSSTELESQPRHTLTGREVLIPAFGGKAAFFEGRLSPEMRSKSRGGSIGNGKEEEEEIIYVSAPAPNSKHRPTKRQPKPPSTESDRIPVSVSDAIEWLRKHSSEPNDVARTTSTKRTPATTATGDTSTVDGRPAPTAPTKQPPPSRPRASDPGGAPPGMPMVNINEEYAADGRRIVGEAVDLSSRLRAVYGDDRPENLGKSPTGGVEESKSEAADAPFDPTLGGHTTATTKPSKAKTVTDEEYDRISRRLEELALMEEESQKKKPAKPLGGRNGGGTVGSIPKTEKNSSSFGFQKGFLNKKKKKKKPCCSPDSNKKNNCCEKKTASATKTVDTEPSKKESFEGSGNEDRGVKIDVSKNRVHEIPREGRQQPVPPRKTAESATGASTAGDNHRLVDASVFTGRVAERTNAMGGSVSAMPPVSMSADAAARVAANEQTRNLQHELEQQRRRQQARPKRVSRFKMQRQQEQQQHPR